MSAVVLGDQKEPRRVFVEAVNDARPQSPTDASQIRTVSQESVDEGMATLAGARVNRQSRRLIYHQQIGVFVDNREGNRLWFQVKRLRRRDTNYNTVLRLERPRRLGRPTINGNKPAFDEALDTGARQFWAAMGHIEVETLAFLLDNDVEESLVQVLSSGCHSVSLSRKKPTMVVTPTTIAESAMLKAGQ